MTTLTDALDVCGTPKTSRPAAITDWLTLLFEIPLAPEEIRIDPPPTSRVVQAQPERGANLRDRQNRRRPEDDPTLGFPKNRADVLNWSPLHIYRFTQ